MDRYSLRAEIRDAVTGYHGTYGDCIKWILWREDVARGYKSNIFFTRFLP